MVSTDNSPSTSITNNQLKTALVYDRINTSYGGAEQVLLALKRLFPDAPLYTSVLDGQQAKWAQSFQIKTSFLQRIPGAKNHHRWFLPLMPLAFEQLDLSGYELIISVSSAEAKGVITKPDQIHINYMLTPPRYLYSHRKQYLQSRPFLNLPMVKGLVRQLLAYQTWWDQAAAHRPDVIVPLSQLVKKRAKKYYNLNTQAPIYPPANMVNLETKLTQPQKQQLQSLNLPKQYLLVVGRLVNYKRVDLAIRSCQQLGLNLVIVGHGPDRKRLQKIASNNTSADTRLIGSQPQTVVNFLMQKAKAVLSLGVEDFGLVPLQANLLGTPAVINSQSGVAEVIQQEGSVKVTDLSTKTITSALSAIQKKNWDKTAMKINAQKFTCNRFLFQFKNVITSLVSKKI